MTRSIPSTMASILEQLELEQPELITTELLSRLVHEAGISTPTRVVAARLRDHGWLLKTSQRGVWEFAPAALAGAYSRGGPTRELRAFLQRAEVPCGLTFHAAAWAHGLADRAPSRIEVAAATAQIAAKLPEVVDASVFAPHLAYTTAKGVPVLPIESVLVHMAGKPSSVRSWSSALEWLPSLAAEATWERMATELTGRAHTVSARLGYLLQGLRPDLVRHISIGISKTWFGPRGPLRHHDNRWMVADTLLPFDPRDLASVQ